LEGIALADAIQAIDEHHFAGHKVLFSDIEAALAKRNGVARELCDLYNETALWYDGELITAVIEACHFDHLGSFCRRRGCKTFAVQHGYGSNTQRVVCDHCHG